MQRISPKYERQLRQTDQPQNLTQNYDFILQDLHIPRAANITIYRLYHI
jgi:hypothetical protein